jgi:hypothetical protein
MNIKNLTVKLKALNVAIAMLCMGLLFFVSCGDEDKSGTHDPSQPLSAISFMPDSGRISEMVILDGANFGTDTSNIKVYFNSKEAITLSSTGTRILALVPRLPGDTCIVSVEVGGKRVTYPERFRYRIEASASTLAGNGNWRFLYSEYMDQLQFGPVFLGIDKNDNIFVTDVNDMFLKINERENSVMVLATGANGFSHRCQVNAHPETGVIMMGNEGKGNMNSFIFFDPEEGWSPKNRYIREWVENDFELPDNTNTGVGEQNYATHYHCLYCKTDGYYYTRYTQGQLVRINPRNWLAEVIYMTPPGVAYGMVFNPRRPSELWLAYSSITNGNLIYTLDVSDSTATLKALNEAGQGHRDGRLNQALFNGIRQIDFDSDGNIFVGDNYNHCIRRIDTEKMTVETVIGIPGSSGFRNGKKEDALFNEPHGLVTDSEGIIYVGDHQNNRIRRIAIE